MNSMFWVTTKCNMCCRYCYEGENKQEENMSIEIADKAIEYTMTHYKKLDSNSLTVGFHGGEPLLQFELIRYIVERFKEYFNKDNEKVYFNLTTNGTLLNKEITDYICNNINEISISLDGTKSTHDTNRIFINGKGTYDLVVNNFTKLLEKRQDIRVRTAFNTFTVGNLCEDVKHLLDLGFKMIVPAPDLFSKDWDSEHMETLYFEMQKIRKLMSQYENSKEIKISIVDIDYKEKPKGACSGGISGIHIDPRGNIYPCIYTVGIGEYAVGNIETGINSDKIEKIYELSKVENMDCRGCGHYKYCNGTRCKIVNKIMTGDYHTPSAVLCNVENINHRFYKECKI